MCRFRSSSAVAIVDVRTNPDSTHFDPANSRSLCCRSRCDFSVLNVNDGRLTRRRLRSLCRSSVGHLTARFRSVISTMTSRSKARPTVRPQIVRRARHEPGGWPPGLWLADAGRPTAARRRGRVVMAAGLEAPNFCPQLNRTVQALLVVLVDTAPTGELYASIYGHLSRFDVQAGFRQRRHGDRPVRQHRLAAAHRVCTSASGGSPAAAMS